MYSNLPVVADLELIYILNNIRIVNKYGMLVKFLIDLLFMYYFYVFLITEILDQIRSFLLVIDPRILIFAFLMTGFVLIMLPVGSSISAI